MDFCFQYSPSFPRIFFRTQGRFLRVRGLSAPLSGRCLVSGGENKRRQRHFFSSNKKLLTRQNRSLCCCVIFCAMRWHRVSRREGTSAECPSIRSTIIAPNKAAIKFDLIAPLENLDPIIHVGGKHAIAVRPQRTDTWGIRVSDRPH